MPIIRLAMAQSNPVVGDLSGNVAGILNLTRKAAAAGANLVQFGEMSITGYPVEDLVTRESFVADAEKAVTALAKTLQHEGLGEVAVVVGAPRKAAAPNGWAIANNAAYVLHLGEVIATYSKHHLPNYSVFDEYRNFVPGNDDGYFELFGIRLSIAICEDIWQAGGPVARIKANHTQLTLVLNGSPFEIDKDDRRLGLVRKLADTQKTSVAYVNLVGGQDDLVFDGDSLFVNSDGSLVARGQQFAEDIVLIDFDGTSGTLVSEHVNTKADDNWQVWNALVLGLRDYVKKNGFSSVVLGLSGGIDSAVVATIAADAIGGENVFGVSMPSKYSSDHSKGDAAILAGNIGCHFETVTIEPMVQTFESNLELTGLASENLQARMRGVILMAMSNSAGHLTLTTGNKSELAVGYSTIYGDSVGGFAPIKDVEKTMVWQLARWRNSWALENGETPPIPENSISKPPSAELRPGQTDQDSLPEYAELDAILDAYVEKRQGVAEIIASGFDATTVEKVVGLVDRAEWKRRQGAIGPKITDMAFGRDRRLPITNKYKG
ncbi:MAG: NAD+ synthase [Actinobacteria bacterium]|uniref:NAD(+) synthase (glutamine-hydrolyzing) n=1 Tax=freshwater metagenome TaxID=449393 RepID=A0A6J6HID5_9ZZZZ|nr:NAD+ synthase [Actinomycetota bacterium]